MSKTYLLQDGGKITATCAIDFVKQLRERSKFDSECSDAEFMMNFAKRFKMYSGKELNTDNAELFFSDLIKCEYINSIE